MACTEVSVEGDRFQITITGNFSRSLLDSEENIRSALNEGGRALTMEALKQLDADGSPIKIGGAILKTKGKLPKQYHTPYGDVRFARHVYQPSRGGATYCPMEHAGRLLMSNTTPLFAKQVASKFARNNVREAQRDLQENHGRKTMVSLLQRISDSVAAVAQAREEDWSYQVPELHRPVASIGVSLDGTCMLMCDSGWREAMTGSLSLYDQDGERLHTIYLGASPEHGKATFLQRLSREIERLKRLYPDAEFVGVADGAECNWTFLEQHTSVQILDFYHASGYLGGVAKAFYPKDIPKQEQWLDTARHMLKHERGAASRLYGKMCELAKNASNLPQQQQKELSAAITYFARHKHQMNYPDYRANAYPIGSGVIEAACKTLIKQRLCQAGMRWKDKGAAAVIALRSLELTPSRWQQFWDKINRSGLPTA